MTLAAAGSLRGEAHARCNQSARVATQAYRLLIRSSRREEKSSARLQPLPLLRRRLLHVSVVLEIARTEDRPHRLLPVLSAHDQNSFGQCGEIHLRAVPVGDELHDKVNANSAGRKLLGGMQRTHEFGGLLQQPRSVDGRHASDAADHLAVFVLRQQNGARERTLSRWRGRRRHG